MIDAGTQGARTRTRAHTPAHISGDVYFLLREGWSLDVFKHTWQLQEKGHPCLPGEQGTGEDTPFDAYLPP